MSHNIARHHEEENTDRQNLENRTLSACRECIEWDYGDVGVMWSMVDYKKILKMQLMPVKNVYLTATILGNAYVTMNGGTTAEYFNLIPPISEIWCAEGPANLSKF